MTLQELEEAIQQQIDWRLAENIPSRQVFINQQLWISLGYPTEYHHIPIYSTVALATRQVLVT